MFSKRLARRNRGLRSDQVEARFVHLLAEAGVDIQAPVASDVDRLRDVMLSFATEQVKGASPAERDGDALLAQFGTHDWGQGERFELDLTRQLIFDDRHDEYDHMMQLNCTFDFAVTDQLRALGSGNLWSMGMGLDEFVDRARELPGFEYARRTGLTPLHLSVAYGQV